MFALYSISRRYLILFYQAKSATRTYSGKTGIKITINS